MLIQGLPLESHDFEIPVLMNPIEHKKHKKLLIISRKFQFTIRHLLLQITSLNLLKPTGFCTYHQV